ncbi:circadian clock KaiB family protein [Thiohalomonas denitrificans]|uniref:Circadian clock protein KaiB n=1 Tax=Thiohalomonas denitrificans TaxID=415747 RepID=A0A1G5QK51_9GAMM|nr:circadian clock KaiB family protein [Thiohalomonas denitrificans]SCZ62137.1 circadian clock protein KaiB [Thiohalomonas denitrificans]
MVELKLRLFVLGQTPPSRRAVAVVERLCREHAGECRLEVTDMAVEPEAAERYNVLATPTLLREEPPPVKRIIGNLSDRERLMEALDIEPGE